MGYKVDATLPLWLNLEELSKLDANALGDFIADGNFIIAEGVSIEPEELPALCAGWELKLTGITKHRTVRNVYIVATTYGTGTIWALGQRNLAARYGLNHPQVMRWVKSKNQLKHLLLPYLNALIHNHEYAAAHIVYSYDFTVEQYQEWFRKYPIMDKLKPMQRKLLVELWNEVILFTHKGAS